MHLMNVTGTPKNLSKTPSNSSELGAQLCLRSSTDIEIWKFLRNSFLMYVDKKIK